MIDYSTVIKSIRIELGMTLKEFAELTGITEGGLNGMELGRIKKPSIDLIATLVKECQVNPYAFIYENQPLFMRHKPEKLTEDAARLKAIKAKVNELAELLQDQPKNIKKRKFPSTSKRKSIQ